MAKATRQFTDRTEPQAAFQNTYLDMVSQMPGENPSRILTYYGMGGIGKTRLLHQLQSNLKSKPVFTEKHKNKPLAIYFDFEDAQDGIQVLLHLRNLLSSDPYNWQFPRFELGLYLYRKSIGEDTPDPETKGYLETTPVLKTAVDIATEIPVIGPLFKFLSLLDQGQAAVRSLIKHHTDIAETFEDMTPQEQRQALPGLFAADLNAYTEKSTTPLVVFLDTYECISENSSQQGSALNRDLWLYGENRLISMAKNALWVIAGRHQIPWSIPRCPMEQHLLGSLSAEDASHFLATSGIPPHLIPDLCKLTDGTPLYLDVCVDHYEQLVLRGELPDISKFGSGDPARLIECYLKYMTPSVRELVYMLTYIPLWDENLVRAAAKEVLDGFNLADFKRVKKLSITLKVDDKRYFIHRAVAEVLRNYEDNESGERTAEFLLNHFAPVIETASPYSNEYSDALNYMMHSGLLLHKDRAALADFYHAHIRKPMRILPSCRRYDQIKQIFAPFWNRANEDRTDLLYATALSENAWWFFYCKEQGNIGIHWGLEALRMFHGLSMDNHYLTFSTIEAVASYFVDYLHRYGEAISLDQYVLDNLQGTSQEAKDLLLATKRNLAIIYKRTKNNDAAASLFWEVLKEREACYEPGDRRRLRAMLDVSSICVAQEDYEQALKIAQDCQKIAEASLSPQHPIIISAIAQQSIAYRKMGDYRQEAVLCKDVLSLRRKNLPKGHQDIIVTISALATAYHNAQNYLAELPLRQELLEHQTNTNGILHTKTLNALKALLETYHAMNDTARQDALCRKWCSLWNNEGPSSSYKMYLLADFVYSTLQDYRLAAEIFECILNQHIRIYDSRLDETSVFHMLGKCYFHCGKLEEALSALDGAITRLSSTSLLSAEIFEDKIRVLREMGRTEEADQLQQVLAESSSEYWASPDSSRSRAQSSSAAPQKPMPVPESCSHLSIPELIDWVSALLAGKPAPSRPNGTVSLKDLIEKLNQTTPVVPTNQFPKFP